MFETNGNTASGDAQSAMAWDTYTGCGGLSIRKVLKC